MSFDGFEKTKNQIFTIERKLKSKNDIKKNERSDGRKFQ